MRAPIVTPPGLIPKSKHNLTFENESLYLRWTVSSLKKGWSTNKIDSPLPISLLNRPIFRHLRDHDVQSREIASALCVDLSTIRRLRGTDICGISDGLVFSSRLRYCPKCLNAGYHSIVYQHVGVARCPLHDIRLQDTCPNCHAEIVPTFATCINHPYECSICSTPFAASTKGSSADIDAKLADQFAGGRRGALTIGYNQFQHDRLLESLGSPSEPETSRHLQRATVWSHPNDPLWLQFSEQTMQFASDHWRGEVNGYDSRDLGIAAERVFIWLFMHCSTHREVAWRLAGRLGRRPQGLRLNSKDTLIGVAIYKLAVAYDMVDEIHAMREVSDKRLRSKANICYGKNVVRYGNSDLSNPTLDQRLLILEMLGMFAKFLVMHKNGDPMLSVSWLEIPPPIEFAPSWCMVRSGDGGFARIRGRINEDGLLRLIRRKWFHMLASQAEEPSIQSWIPNKDEGKEPSKMEKFHADWSFFRYRLGPPP